MEDTSCKTSIAKTCCCWRTTMWRKCLHVEETFTKSSRLTLFLHIIISIISSGISSRDIATKMHETNYCINVFLHWLYKDSKLCIARKHTCMELSSCSLLKIYSSFTYIYMVYMLVLNVFPPFTCFVTQIFFFVIWPLTSISQSRLMKLLPRCKKASERFWNTSVWQLQKC